MHFPVDQQMMVGLREAQRILKIGRSTMHDLIHSGSLPAQKIGNEWRIQGKYLVLWLQNQPHFGHTDTNCSPFSTECSPGYEFIGDWT